MKYFLGGGQPVVSGKELRSREEWFIITVNERALPAEMLFQLNSKNYRMNRDYISISSSVGIVSVFNGYKDQNANEIRCMETIQTDLLINGYRNQLEIESGNCTLEQVEIQLKGNAKLFIGEGCIFKGKCRIEAYDGEVRIGSHCVLEDSSLSVIQGTLRIEKNSVVSDCRMEADKNGSIQLGAHSTLEEKVCIEAIRGGQVRIHTCCVIGQNSVIRAHFSGTVELGNRIAIGGYACISAAHPNSGVVLGADCILSRDVSIWGDHGHALINLETQENKTLLSENGVKVEPHVWLGNKVTVLPGSSVGADSIIGAGSVVKGHFKENQVLAGNPARVIHGNYTWDRQIDRPAAALERRINKSGRKADIY